jgi:hypothetical protein
VSLDCAVFVAQVSMGWLFINTFTLSEAVSFPQLFDAVQVSSVSQVSVPQTSVPHVFWAPLQFQSRLSRKVSQWLHVAIARIGNPTAPISMPPPTIDIVTFRRKSMRVYPPLESTVLVISVCLRLCVMFVSHVKFGSCSFNPLITRPTD